MTGDFSNEDGLTGIYIFSPLLGPSWYILRSILSFGRPGPDSTEVDIAVGVGI
jgi:hypothetical protein